MGFDFSKLGAIFKFIVKIILAGHDAGLWDKSAVLDETNPDHDKVVKLLDVVNKQ